jgi:hypothetical protein
MRGAVCEVDVRRCVMRIWSDICFWLVLAFFGSHAIKAMVVVYVRVSEGDPGSA